MIIEALELSQDARDRLKELRALSQKASESGSLEARLELRKVLRASGPEVVARASEFAREGQKMVIHTMADASGEWEPLREEALKTKLDSMRAELLADGSSVLEALLVEKIVSAWLVGEFFEGILCAQLMPGVKQASSSYTTFLLGWQQQAHRRLLGAIKTLAQVRKLQSNAPPSLQVNTQLNIGGK